MRLSLAFYNQLKDSIRISDIVRQKVNLTKKGHEYLGICPFHNEKTPSFTVNDGKKFYYCFGCHAHGDIMRFISETQGMSYRDAAIKIATENGIDLPKMSDAEDNRYKESEKICHILELASQFFVSQLTTEVKTYLKTRGVNDHSIQEFAIGYAPGYGELVKFFDQRSLSLKDLPTCGLFGKNKHGKIYEIFNKRIMFPIKNSYNKVIGFGGRSLGDAMPKYINSPETTIFKKSETLFGENLATSHAYKINQSILVEGYMDVIALYQAGFKNTFASLGTAVTENHIQKLWQLGKEIIVCLDGDTAGIKASNRIINLSLPFLSTDKSISFIQLQAGFDPDDLIKSKGSAEFKKMILDCTSMSELIWQQAFQNKSFRTAESRASLEKTLDDYCLLIKDNVLKTNFRRYFKEMIWHNITKNNKTAATALSNANNQLLNLKHHTEIEFIEHSICLFILKFPTDIAEMAENISLCNPSLNEFKYWILDRINKTIDSNNMTLEEEIKISRFYDTYLVLSNVDNLFLDVILSKNKEGINQKLAFEWLCKKHHLLLLKQEYVATLKQCDSDATELKSFAYCKEIQKVSKELEQLSKLFIN